MPPAGPVTTGGGASKRMSPIRCMFLALIIIVSILTLFGNTFTLKRIYGNVDSASAFYHAFAENGHHAHPMLSHLVDSFVIDVDRKTEEEKGAEETERDFNIKEFAKEEAKDTGTTGGGHQIADLNCELYGGPSSSKSIDDMVYWSDIPSDSNVVSPFYDEEKFLTFEPDRGGWNNIRMAMETILVMAHAMGRTVVLPPENHMYLLRKTDGGQKKKFGFNDFFHIDSIGEEHDGLNVITMEEFLSREAITGKLESIETGEPKYPPGNIVKWDGRGDMDSLNGYLREVGTRAVWNQDCVVAIPASKDQGDIELLKTTFDDILRDHPKEDAMDFNGKPTPVDASVEDRLREMRASRKNICIYDAEMQNHRLVHFKVDHSAKARLLIHSYAYVFFQDWKMDLWAKRFVRDHVRYKDELMCAAGRIVEAIRTRVRQRGHSDGEYYAMHIRRGDFQYKKTRLPAEDLFKLSTERIPEASTLYIATDERDKDFFKPFKDKYDVFFLDDFKHLIPDLNTNYYGMLDQVVCYRSLVFHGTFFSSFTGYINRIRGYYNSKYQKGRYEEGVLDSWYFYPPDRVEEMRMYKSVRPPYYMREFPVGWRDLDKGLYPALSS